MADDTIIRLGVGESTVVNLQIEDGELEATFSRREEYWVKAVIVQRRQRNPRWISLEAAADLLRRNLREGENLEELLHSLSEGQAVPVNGGVLTWQNGKFRLSRIQVKEFKFRKEFRRPIYYEGLVFKIFPPLPPQKPEKKLTDYPSYRDMLQASWNRETSREAIPQDDV